MLDDDKIDVNDLDWLPEEGVPDDWVTLFCLLFENGYLSKRKTEFRLFGKDADAVVEFARNNGFYERLDKHLHRTVCIDIDIDCYVLEWHLSFPSEKERIAWILSVDRDENKRGWYLK